MPPNDNRRAADRRGMFLYRKPLWIAVIAVVVVLMLFAYW